MTNKLGSRFFLSRKLAGKLLQTNPVALESTYLINISGFNAAELLAAHEKQKELACKYEVEFAMLNGLENAESLHEYNMLLNENLDKFGDFLSSKI